MAKSNHHSQLKQQLPLKQFNMIAAGDSTETKTICEYADEYPFLFLTVSVTPFQ